MKATSIFLEQVQLVRSRQEAIRSQGGTVVEQMAVRCDLSMYDKATRRQIQEEAENLYDLLEEQQRRGEIDLLTCTYGQMTTHSIVFSVPAGL